jgi:hypothetical protein
MRMTTPEAVIEHETEEDRAVAVVLHCTEGFDGLGWYYHDADYWEEGGVGAFASKQEAEGHAREADYRIAAESKAQGGGQ